MRRRTIKSNRRGSDNFICTKLHTLLHNTSRQQTLAWRRALAQFALPQIYFEVFCVEFDVFTINELCQMLKIAASSRLFCMHGCWRFGFACGGTDPHGPLDHACSGHWWTCENILLPWIHPKMNDTNLDITEYASRIIGDRKINIF